ncbi:TenA family protein [Geodermatophilus obscurus]|uniref:Transcriptional activator, TenA family n=1 Tax=Geodermatophilus obscurus (strain ATCC 25078 / DSM 43160 / JCM 3152 / CCUG 61914 / KCC A-0152 / KCTC 9177 / NBRC 13315 / NRRL B-3577 / G-20) TaxID=526225 RepID=D2SGM4_GEOOG|nr:TenA family protein [Geodermatophilus obscurus]ADB72906.1 transcriptional activator, TenA family [Geodermatophilus obscurus DSM 43160]
MSLAAELWTANADLAAEALAHPFVTGVGDGTLPQAVFSGYVAQDAFFLESFARAYAVGIAHSPDRATLDTFADLLAGVREELALHAGYAARWGIDLVRVEPLPATLAYTDFLLSTAFLGGITLTAAAMTPCVRLYAHLGRSLSAETAGDYAEWVTTYADPGFEELAVTLERLLDQHASDVPAVRTAYRRAMQLEVGFFEAAWRGA